MIFDHVAQAESRILWQYRNGEKFRQWVGILPKIAQEDLEKPLDLLIDILDIDRQEGAQLDLLGRIVGVVRRLIEVDDATSVFDLGGGQMGDDSSQLTAPTYTTSSQFGDAVFRLLIRARIARNNSEATLDEVSRAVQIVVPDNIVRVRDNQDMTFELTFLDVLSPIERFVIKNYDIIPRPQGVGYQGFIEEPLFMQLGSFQLGDEQAQLNGV